MNGYKYYQIRPVKCTDIEAGTMELCTPEETHCYGVYGSDQGQEFYWIADCTDQKTAKILVDALERPLLDQYLSEFTVIDGLEQHPSGYNFEQWKNKRG